MIDDAKDRIMAAVLALLEEMDDPDNITSRQIAEKAGVGLGSINYHFGSKDHLLIDAIGSLMEAEAARFDPAVMSEVDPVLRLKGMLKQMAHIGLRYPNLMRHLLGHTLLNGDMGAEMVLIPVLREIFGQSRSEVSLRLAAFQIVAPVQTLALRGEQFYMYSGLDPRNADQLDAIIDILVDNLLIGKGLTT